MIFRRLLLIVSAAALPLIMGGCDNSALRKENEDLAATVLKYEQENRSLMAQIEALRSKPEGIDPAELQRLEAEIHQRERKIQVLRRAIRDMQGQVALSEQIETKLQLLADELGGELVGNRLLLPGDYFFSSGRYDLMPDGKRALRKFAEVMRRDRFMLMISGHTDNVPIKASRRRGIKSNRQLSLMRALSVLEELKKNGYPKNLMYPTGWGALKPISSNDSRQGRQRNRRVEIYIDPAGSDLMSASAITEVKPIGSEGVIIRTPSATIDTYNDGGPITAED